MLDRIDKWLIDIFLGNEKLLIVLFYSLELSPLMLWLGENDEDFPLLFYFSLSVLQSHS